MTKKRIQYFAWGCAALVAASAIVSGCSSSAAEENNRLVILHTNDTHSHIDPLETTGLGGVARRKVLIDSVRAAEPNVLLVDAGDVVQGTLYFQLYKGKAEQQLINALGYDIQILGNHEFDNGTKSLAEMLRGATPTLLATNYVMADSSDLAGIFVLYTVKEYGGKRIGIFSINLNPEGMVAEGNYDGVSYVDWKSVVQPTVDMLRGQEKADAVIAVTHIGYEGSSEKPDLFGDADVVAATRGIDIVIGGHSHTKLPENLRLANADGDSVLVVQTGKYGQYLGEITLDLNNMKSTSRLIPVDSRLDADRDGELMAMIEPWRAGVDSLYNHEVARVAPEAGELNSGSVAMQNYAADFVREVGGNISPGVQGAITNKGGLRVTWRPGALTEGAVIDMMPFVNRIVVIDIKGSDLMASLDVMAGRGGDAVSSDFSVNTEGGKVTSATLGGKPINPDVTYRIATIDYLAKGGDYMTPMTRASLVVQSPNVAYDDLLNYLKVHPTVNPDQSPRMK